MTNFSTAPRVAEPHGEISQETMHGSWFASGSSPIRCESTCSASRRRCAPTPAEWDEDEELYAVTGAGPRPRLRALSGPRDRPSALRDQGAGGARLPAGGDRRRRRPRGLHGRPPRDPMAKTLYAVDELSGFVAACALVRPTGIEGMKPKSVKKKLKQPSFAAAVNRDEVQSGIDELGVDQDEHIALIIEALAERSDELGLVSRWLKITLGILGRARRSAACWSSTRSSSPTRPRPPRRTSRAPSSWTPRAARSRCWTRATRRGRPDRADPLATLLDGLVGQPRAAAGAGPPRDPHRPARARRLRQAGGRLRDRRPGERDRRGAGEADVVGATVVGHSLGGTVAAALAEQSPQLASRSLIVDQAPDDSFEHDLAAARNSATSPVIGQAIGAARAGRAGRHGPQRVRAGLRSRLQHRRAASRTPTRSSTTCAR